MVNISNGQNAKKPPLGRVNYPNSGWHESRMTLRRHVLFFPGSGRVMRNCFPWPVYKVLSLRTDPIICGLIAARWLPYSLPSIPFNPTLDLVHTRIVVSSVITKVGHNSARLQLHSPIQVSTGVDSAGTLSENYHCVYDSHASPDRLSPRLLFAYN